MTKPIYYLTSVSSHSSQWDRLVRTMYDRGVLPDEKACEYFRSTAAPCYQVMCTNVPECAVGGCCLALFQPEESQEVVYAMMGSFLRYSHREAGLRAICERLTIDAYRKGVPALAHCSVDDLELQIALRDAGLFGSEHTGISMATGEVTEYYEFRSHEESAANHR